MFGLATSYMQRVTIIAADTWPHDAQSSMPCSALACCESWATGQTTTYPSSIVLGDLPLFPSSQLDMSLCHVVMLISTLCSLPSWLLCVADLQVTFGLGAVQ